MVAKMKVYMTFRRKMIKMKAFSVNDFMTKWTRQSLVSFALLTNDGIASQSQKTLLNFVRKAGQILSLK